MFWRLKTLLVLFAASYLAFQPAHAQQVGGHSYKPIPRPQQTLKQMGEDFKTLGFITPKNLPYHEVEVVLGDDSVRASPILRVIKTRGWLLPGKANSSRFFVAWNGWVYRAQSVGAKADWRVDATNLIQNAALPVDGSERIVRNDVWQDDETLAFDKLVPLKVVMLELLGQHDLARRALGICIANKPRWGDELPGQKNTLVRFEFAGDWMWPGINRVARAIRQDDDETALRTLRILSRALDTIGDDEDLRNHASIIHILLADQERRTAKKAAPQNEKSLAFLLWDLQNVGLVPPSPVGAKAPSYTDMHQDKRLQALVAKGDAAVEPLLEALAADHRLTRFFSTDDWHTPIPYRTYYRVSDVVLWALQDILRTEYESVALATLESEVWREHELGGNEHSISLEEAQVIAKTRLAEIIRANWKKLH